MLSVPDDIGSLAWWYLRSKEMLHKQKKETKATEIATKSKNSWQVACLACNFKVKFTYHITWKITHVYYIYAQLILILIFLYIYG